MGRMEEEARRGGQRNLRSGSRRWRRQLEAAIIGISRRVGAGWAIMRIEARFQYLIILATLRRIEEIAKDHAVERKIKSSKK